MVQVRGAPAIGIVASLSVAAELLSKKASSSSPAAAHAQKELVSSACARLRTARPTAVNLGRACDDMEGEDDFLKIKT